MRDTVEAALLAIACVLVLLLFIVSTGCTLPPEPTDGDHQYTTQYGVAVYRMPGAFDVPSEAHMDAMIGHFHNWLTASTHREPRDTFARLTILYYGSIYAVQTHCGDHTAGCYWQGNQLIVAPATVAHCTKVTAHELLHHGLARLSYWPDADHELHALWRSPHGPVEQTIQNQNCFDTSGALQTDQPTPPLVGDVY